MIDINLIRKNPELVKENIKKKFQNHKLVFVDEVSSFDQQAKQLKYEVDTKRNQRKKLSEQVGQLMREKKMDEADTIKAQVGEINEQIAKLEEEYERLQSEINKRMVLIPNIMAEEVPIGKDDTENVEREQFLKQTEHPFEIRYHLDILEKVGGIDLDSARKISGQGFYFLLGDIARLQSAMLSYARDFMIDKGFTYAIPPFMLRGEMVKGVMSFEEMDSMMYKIEGEDLYLIGTSEHSMISRFIDTILDENKLPLALTSYSPCFRKEKGAHGIEERGVYRVHQFEKQEMIVICRPEDSVEWYDKLWKHTVEFATSMNIPVRTLECCSGDLADLKYRSVDVEAWSPRQKKYFEIGSCSNMTDAQARRLGIRIRTEQGNILAHTLNNTVAASPRIIIAFVENNLNEDGSIDIPKVLQPYMGGKTKIAVQEK